MKLDEYKAWSWKMGQHKCLEIQVSRWSVHKKKLIGGEFDIRRKGITDHHGIHVEIVVLGRSLSVDFYDGRHMEDFHND